ncbi:hypothetical protein [Thermogemmatispora onikobensis]|uniref:hypothetical protein n=1 Tax=Thermogemmatispora onikobensis TaxID=732234 RepID=UPI00114C9E3D|nr:hypothetical protein [Thermogemmatispora onikobensis]
MSSLAGRPAVNGQEALNQGACSSSHHHCCRHIVSTRSMVIGQRLAPGGAGSTRLAQRCDSEGGETSYGD